jgi:hypothetical protein
MSALLQACTRSGIAGLLLISAASFGHARPDARTLTCSQVQALLDKEGAAVVVTGPRTFDRYVSAQASCGGLEIQRPASIATKDTDQCQVHTCQRRSRPSSR